MRSREEGLEAYGAAPLEARGETRSWIAEAMDTGITVGRGSEAPRGEAVAWWIHGPADTFPSATNNKLIAEMYKENGWPIRPLVFGDAAPERPDTSRRSPDASVPPLQGDRGAKPLVAAVVSDEMVEAGAEAYYTAMYGRKGGRWESVNPDHRFVWRDKARAVLTAALSASRGGG